MENNSKNPIFMSDEARDLLLEISDTVEKCDTMIRWVHEGVGLINSFEKSCPANEYKKRETVVFTDIAWDYIVEARRKLERLLDVVEIIENAPAPTTVQGATNNRLQDAAEV